MWSHIFFIAIRFIAIRFFATGPKGRFIPSFFVLASALFSPCPQVANSQVLGAQVGDLAGQARMGREQLAKRAAAVDSVALRARLLHSAENDRLTHWYAGKIFVDGQWLTLEQTQQQAAQDKQRTAYRKLRAQAADRLSDHERLARWCAKHKLADLANMHWLHVLQFDRAHRAALNKLELTWYQGMLLTHDEAQRYQDREREWLKQKKAWLTKVKRLRRALEKDLGEEDFNREKIAARQELREIRAPAAVPALLEEFLEPARDEEKTFARRSELMTVLGGIDAPTAVEALAQFAVESPDESIRYAAIHQLKAKPLAAFVPALLAGLAMPIEASVSINNSGSRVVSSYSYSQEKPGGNEYTENRHSYQTVPGARYLPVRLYRPGRYVSPRTIQGITRKVPINPGHGSGLVRRQILITCGHNKPIKKTIIRREYGAKYLKEVTTPDVNLPGGYSAQYAGIGYAEDPAFASRQQAARGKLQQQAQQARRFLEEHNRATVLQNERIASVLSEVTGETLSAFPKSWWNWWSGYLDHHPGLATVGSRQQLNRLLLNQASRGLARGTWVWTRRGQRAVETVLPGDYVLAQEPRTGELAYKMVLAIAMPQPLTVSKVDFREVDFSDAELRCAPGHVVWATGTGWQRVSKLTSGQSLHGVTSAARVEQVDTAFEIDSYDLVVDGFHTLFVGKQGLLVHDATPVGPAHVALPGFSSAAVADAVKLAANVR